MPEMVAYKRKHGKGDLITALRNARKIGIEIVFLQNIRCFCVKLVRRFGYLFAARLIVCILTEYLSPCLVGFGNEYFLRSEIKLTVLRSIRNAGILHIGFLAELRVITAKLPAIIMDMIYHAVMLVIDLEAKVVTRLIDTIRFEIVVPGGGK